MTSSFTIRATYAKHQLKFKFDAGTSRGVLKVKDTFYIKVVSDMFPGVIGYGEAGPLPRLSVDDRPDFEQQIETLCERISGITLPTAEQDLMKEVEDIVPPELPSVRFALEVALLDLMNGGTRKLFENDFYKGTESITINGLIWMGDREFMFEQIQQKLREGYNCIKMKIGSIDFEQEYRLLSFVREQFGPDQITLRVDANGAFSEAEAMNKLDRLAELQIHSIEQPIQQGQIEPMSRLCRNSPVPIALDEELIGVHGLEEKIHLLEQIRPPFIILKPTLLGGIQSTRTWIQLAEERGIGWWMTSALESNIGLNAIAQLTSTCLPDLPQGLGTGQLYHNNIDSPLTINNGKLVYDQTQTWGEIQSFFIT